ncbi:MAG: phage major capsid protein, partial [Oceanicaulis sp.]
AMKQSGAALEAAIRRDLAGAIGSELDKAAFLGSGSSGQPLGMIAGAATYGITATDVDAAATWSAFRAAVVRFMTANAAGNPNAVRLMLRPEVWSDLDDTLISGTAVSEWDRLTSNVPAGNIVMTANALAAPAGDPLESSAFLTTTAGGVAPGYVGLWGAVDLIRDPYTKAASGALKLTALTTADVTVARPAQSQVLNGIR